MNKDKNLLFRWQTLHFEVFAFAYFLDFIKNNCYFLFP
jgi:hypothetical protein